MKKIVCEICGSTKLRKTGDFFVCQECGTEYSLSEAQNLLKDINDTVQNNNIEKNTNLKIGPVQEDVKYLASQIKSWGSLCMLAENLVKLTRVKNVNINDLSFWSPDAFDEIKPIRIASFSSPSLEKKYSQKKQNDVSFDDKFKKSFSKLEDIYYEGIENFYDLPSRVEPDCRYWIYDNALKCYGALKDVFKPYTAPFYGLEEFVDLYIKNDTKFLIMEKYVKYKLFGNHHLQIGSTYYSDDFQTLIKALAKIKKDNLQLDKELKDKIKQKYDYYVSNFPNFSKIHKNILVTSAGLEKIFNLPVKYRTSAHCIKFLDLILDGRAENWKELVNLYETVLHREVLEASLTKVFSTLDTLNKTLLKGFSMVNYHLNSINSNICVISDQIDNVASKIDDIDTNVNVSVFLNT